MYHACLPEQQDMFMFEIPDWEIANQTVILVRAYTRVTHLTVWNLQNFITDSQLVGCQTYITWNYLPTHQLPLEWEQNNKKENNRPQGPFFKAIHVYTLTGKWGKLSFFIYIFRFTSKDWNKSVLKSQVRQWNYLLGLYCVSGNSQRRKMQGGHVNCLFT